MHKTDPRVIRTRKMLGEALIALILERGYDAINIGDITERAGLRRATFYLHYRNKEELLFGIMQEVLEELTQKMEALPDYPFGEKLLIAEERITFQHVQERADLYRAMLSGQGAAQITRNIRECLAAQLWDKYATRRLNSNVAIPIDILANYLVGVKLNMIIWWLEKGMPYPPEEMAVMCARLAFNGVGKIMKSGSQR
jgi:AcrR family transcriptional regulator